MNEAKKDMLSGLKWIAIGAFMIWASNNLF